MLPHGHSSIFLKLSSHVMLMTSMCIFYFNTKEFLSRNLPPLHNINKSYGTETNIERTTEKMAGMYIQIVVVE